MHSVSVFLLVTTCLVICTCANQDAASGPLLDTQSPLRARVSTRKENNLSMELSGRAGLLFRSMDKDHDRKISEEDVRQSHTELQQHLPRVSEAEFLSFMEVADQDGDKMLNLEELLKGLSDGLQEAKETQSLPVPQQQAPTPAAAAAAPTAADDAKPNLLETEASMHADARAGRRRRDESEARFTALDQRAQIFDSDSVKGGDDDCVMCQYIIERCEANVKQSGVLPGFSSVAAFDSYLELDQQITPHDNAADDASGDVSLLEVQSTATATAEHKQLYFDQTAAGIIGSTRQATRVQRQLERQKYNEVYRVTDLTLDDVCEQGMPIKFYGICKKIYKLQSDVVDGLRYQYRPADICFRVGLCPKGSYITTGIHSRYKGV